MLAIRWFGLSCLQDFDDQEDPTEQYAHFERFLPPAKQAAWSSDRSKSTNGILSLGLDLDQFARVWPRRHARPYIVCTMRFLVPMDVAC